MAKSPYKMKAGKEGPMRKNFSSAFKKDTGNESDIDKKQKTYENEWKKSAAYINLTKANAPKEVLDKAKNKWSGLNKNK